jgi:hypothetical protein
VIPAKNMKNIMLCILAFTPAIAFSQSFQGLLHRLIIDGPDVLDMISSYNYHSKMKLADKKVTGIYLYANCEKAYKEVSIEVKLNTASRVYKLPCDDGFYNSLGYEIYIPTGTIAYNQITKLELHNSAGMLLRWSEIHFDTMYNKDLSGKSFAKEIATFEAAAQEGLYVHSRRNMDDVDSRMFALRMLSAYPSVAALQALQNRFLYDGEFFDEHLQLWGTITSKNIYSQMLKMYKEEEVANVLIKMHDFNDTSRKAHEVRLPVLNFLKSAAGLSYALITEKGYLPDPGLDKILDKKDAGVYVEKQKAFILERIFSEFNEDKSSVDRTCRIFERFPQKEIFGTLIGERENLFCLNAMTSILNKLNIPAELKPHMDVFKKSLALTNINHGMMDLALLAFLQVKTPGVVPQLKLITKSSKVRAETALMAKKVLESYAK